MRLIILLSAGWVMPGRTFGEIVDYEDKGFRAYKELHEQFLGTVSIAIQDISAQIDIPWIDLHESKLIIYNNTCPRDNHNVRRCLVFSLVQNGRSLLVPH